MLPYSMSKAALFNQTTALVRDLGPHNITVNLIAPGYFDTLRNAAYLRTPGDKAKAAEKLILRRLGEPRDCTGLRCCWPRMRGPTSPDNTSVLTAESQFKIMSLMSPFTLLADPSSYVACDWDFSVDEDGRVYWCDLFKKHLRLILKLGIEMAVVRDDSLADAEQRAAQCAGDFDSQIDGFAARARAIQPGHDPDAR